MVGYIHSKETFGAVDGPGIRFVFFLQGCPLRCQYCHNPDTWERGGTPIQTDEAVREVLKYRSYIKKGGVTLSGGEPLLQLDFVTDLCRALKKEGIHVAIDTSGYPFRPNDPECIEKFTTLIQYVDLFLLDIKSARDEVHKPLTGVSNERTLAFSRFLSKHKVPTWIRYVLVPGVTDAKEDITALKAHIDTLCNVEKVEVLPYHTMGEVKYQKLGIPYPLSGVEAPSKEAVEYAKELLK